jgi:outer membrane lipoprotein-sorting protein
MLKDRFVRVVFVIGLAVCSFTPGASALDPSSTDARAILKEAFGSQRGEKTASRMKMSIKDGSGTRERMMSVRTARKSDGWKTLILIEQPEDVRNTGFLSMQYVANDKSDEQWLYLPKLHRVARVPSSGKSDPFVGSDFSISDLSQQEVDDFDAKLVSASVKVGDEECWLIESTPRTQVIREETGYEKTQLWISKSKLLPIQIKASVIGGKKTKYFKAMDIRKVDGYWTPYRMQMRTMDGSTAASETVLDVLNADNQGKDVAESDFTVARLEHGV